MSLPAPSTPAPVPAEAGLVTRRAAAVDAFIAAARAIAAEGPVDRPALARIGAALTRLGEEAELFPLAHFPVEAGTHGTIYRLAEDQDGRFALFASAGVPGKAVPPHDHTTWAVIAGVHGREHNVLYRRLPDAASGEGRLEKAGEATAARGGPAVTLLPDDVHTIAIEGDAPGLHLHFYGVSLDRLDKRVRFAGPEGGAFAHFAAPPVFRAPRLSAGEIGEAGLVLLDVRDPDAVSAGHLPGAVPASLGALEAAVPALVPDTAARLVVVDADETQAHRAADRLVRLGYRSVSVLKGGAAAA